MEHYRVLNKKDIDKVCSLCVCMYVYVYVCMCVYDKVCSLCM
jgi:hypothetical protein